MKGNVIGNRRELMELLVESHARCHNCKSLWQEEPIRKPRPLANSAKAPRTLDGSGTSANPIPNLDKTPLLGLSLVFMAELAKVPHS